MNTPHEKTETTTTKPRRPGFWLRAIEHRKHRLTREYRATLGDTAREGISDEDYATTMATLEKMARNLGWDESEFEGRDRHGFGPGFRPGFGPGMGRRHFGRGHGHGRPFPHERHERGERPSERPDVASDGTES